MVEDGVASDRDFAGRRIDGKGTTHVAANNAVGEGVTLGVVREDITYENSAQGVFEDRKTLIENVGALVTLAGIVFRV